MLPDLQTILISQLEREKVSLLCKKIIEVKIVMLTDKSQNSCSLKRVHSRFGGMRDLAFFHGDIRDASWKQGRETGI